MFQRLTRRLLPLLVVLLPGMVRAQEAAPPDKLVLKSGSTLLGTITSITKDQVTIDLPGNKGIKVAWSDVETMTTAEPFLLGRSGEPPIDALIKGRAGDQLEVVVGKETRQVPIESLQEVVGGRAGVEWKGLITLGVGAATGNTDRRSGNANFDVTRRTVDDRLEFKARWNQESTKDPATLDWSRTDRYVGGTLRYDRFVTSRLFYFGRTGAESDFNADLDVRFTADAGLGYQLLDTDKLDYSIQAGLGFVSEHFSTPGNNNDFAAATVSHDFAWTITDGLALLHDLTAIFSLESKDDVLVKADTRLRWTMVRDLFAELQWVLAYDNTPAAGAERLDDRYFLNFGWNF